MTTKKKSKNVAKKSAPKKLENEMFDTVLASFHSAFPTPLDQRKELLVKVAGAVAAGLVTAPSPLIASPTSMATAAVDIAEAILNAAGIPVVESSAAGVEAAS